MGGSGWQDVAFSAAAWTLGILGVLLLVWALFWDRSRGRKRCPRCWYDMSGAGGSTALKCPECGKDARRERRLLRTRRHWRWALLGALLLLAAYPVYHVPIVRRAGWWAAAPTWVLILKVPDVHDEAVGFFRQPTGDRMALAIGDRLFETGWKLRPRWWFERALLRRAATRALDQEEISARRLGARLSVCLHKDAVARAPEGVRGMVALFAVGEAYANADSCIAVGVTEFDKGPARSILVFKRDGGYRWEIRGTELPDHAPMHMAAWNNTDVTKSWNEQGGVAIERYPGDATEVMSMVYPWVPTQPLGLLGAVPLRRQFHLPDMYDPAWRGLEDIDGVPCDHVAAYTLQREVVEVWIERESRCIRRLRYAEWFNRGTTTYTTRLNVPVEEALLQFDPHRPDDTPLMRGEVDLPSLPDH
jgi:hypothetical protein